MVDLGACPWAEVAWYFPDTREQYRLLGQVTVISIDGPEDEKLQRARTAAWRAMSDGGRQQFLWPHPGLPRDVDGEGEGEGGSSGAEADTALFNPPAPSKDDPVADAFCLCVVEVQEVDLLCLKSNRRRAFRREGGEGEGAQGGWTETAVNP